ncbi:endonuclease domain-containing 1 protein-like [Montipora capricornis]
MFDVGYGIPIYSAYVVSKADASKIGTITRKDLGGDNWRQEAGLAKQASDSTYDPQKTYDKGHLVPAQTYSFTEPHMNSTFTYTNAVPQNSGFNRGQWALYENKIREYAKSECSPKGGDLYLITGISEVSLQKKAGNKLEAIQKTELQDLGAGTAPKVSIPGSMWTAGCCIVPSIGAVESFAVIGNNLKTTKVESLNMNTLQDFLLIGVHGFGEKTIELFPENPKCSDPEKNVNLNKRKAT